MPVQYVVRYGRIRLLGEFAARERQEFPRGAEVIIRTDRGVEWGEVLCAADERTRSFLGQKSGTGRILRGASAEDERTRDEQWRREQRYFDDVRTVISEARLAMQLIDVEQLFGGERVVCYYTSEVRIDFRELVKSLARKLNTRVELRQVGIRDEAKLLADYGDCGKPVCCNTHLREMPPVSMKMAKLQKATLDPTKISGRCGRLKCCLRYENDVYEEYKRDLPGVGRFVITREGKGRVLAQEVLAKKLLVGYDDNRRVLVDLQDVLTVVAAGPSSRPASPESETAMDDDRVE